MNFKTEKNQRIYIIGMMGVGKSTIGKKIAGLLGYHFIDLDVCIEMEEGKTITQIFELKGEDYFRRTESIILRSLNKGNEIISTGGGTPCHDNNMEFIKQQGISIYLEATEGHILQRVLQQPSKRPLLVGMNKEEIRLFLHSLLKERETYYQQADHIFKVPGTSAETIVKSMLSSGSI